MLILIISPEAILSTIFASPRLDHTPNMCVEKIMAFNVLNSGLDSVIDSEVTCWTKLQPNCRVGLSIVAKTGFGVL